MDSIITPHFEYIQMILAESAVLPECMLECTTALPSDRGVACEIEASLEIVAVARDMRS